MTCFYQLILLATCHLHRKMLGKKFGRYIVSSFCGVASLKLQPQLQMTSHSEFFFFQLSFSYLPSEPMLFLLCSSLVMCNVMNTVWVMNKCLLIIIFRNYVDGGWWKFPGNVVSENWWPMSDYDSNTIDTWQGGECSRGFSRVNMKLEMKNECLNDAAFWKVCFVMSHSVGH